jgi:hypothetical protein
MNVRRFLLLVCLTTCCLLVAGSAAAQTKSPRNQIGGVGCPYDTMDQCFTMGDWWYGGPDGNGGFGLSCSISGGCWTCMPNVFGKQICAYGVSSGGCNCSDVQRAGSGPGITDCTPTGQCTQRTNP